MNLLNMAAFIRIVLSTTPFVLMTLRSGNINLEHKYRGHQFLMPLIAFVYCIPLMFTANRVAEGLVGAVKAVSAVASFIPGVGGPLRRLIEKAYSVLDLGYGIQLLCKCHSRSFLL